MGSFEESSFGQSAASGISAGGNVSIGDITQHISLIRLSNDQNIFLRNIITQYDRKKEDIAKEFEDGKEIRELSFFHDLEKHQDELRRDIENFQIRIEQIGPEDLNYTTDTLKLEQLKEDLKRFQDLLRQLKQIKLSKILGFNVEAKDFWEKATTRLSSNTRTNIRTTKLFYDEQQNQATKEFSQEIAKIEREKIIEIFNYLYTKSLAQYGYPLNSDVRKEIKSFIQPLASTFDIHIDSLEKDLIKPYYQKKFQEYEQQYKQKIAQEGYPLSSSSISELEELKRALSLDNLTFTDMNPDVVEKNAVRPFYQQNLNKYAQKYKQKIEHEGYPPNPSIILEMENFKKTLGIDNVLFPDLDVRTIEEYTIKPFYQESLQQYEQEYRKNFAKNGYPLTPEGFKNIQFLRKKFGLESAFFERLSLQGRFPLELDIDNIESSVEKPFYQENLRKYTQKMLRESEQEQNLANYKASPELQNLQQSLGLKDEDARLVGDLIKNQWSATHLIDSKFESDYWDLRKFLLEQKWQKADEKTRNVMLKIIGREKEGNLNRNSITSFPEIDLFIIDRLWQEYSRERFGLSIQKRIFDDVKQDRQKFAEKVGWSGKAGLFKGAFAWKAYNELSFSLDAPEGHLPVWGAKDKRIVEDDFFHLRTWRFDKQISFPRQPSVIMGLDFSSLPEAVVFAFYGILFKVAASDGSTAPEELRYIYESMDEYNLPESVKTNLIPYQTNPPRLDDCLHGLSLVDEEVRWELFFHLLQVSLADKFLAPAEERIVQLVQSHFKVTDKQSKAVQLFVQTMMEIGENKLNPNQVKEVTQKVILRLHEEAVPVPKAFRTVPSTNSKINQVSALEGLPLKKIGKFALGAAVALAAIYGVSLRD